MRWVVAILAGGWLLLIHMLLLPSDTLSKPSGTASRSSDGNGRNLGSAAQPTAREVRRGRRYDGIMLDPPKFGRGPNGETWRLEEGLPVLIADCRALLDANSKYLVLTVYAIRMSPLAIGELLQQAMADLDAPSRWAR